MSHKGYVKIGIVAIIALTILTGVLTTNDAAHALPTCDCDTNAGCDDKEPGINPGAKEICGNLIDEDCNGFGGVCAKIADMIKAKKIGFVKDDVINQTGVRMVWDVGVTGKGQTVCVIDSGIDYNHPNLSASYIGGYDFVNNDSDPMDDYGHGTYVSGIVTGIAPDAKILAAKVFGSNGTGYESDILAGIDYCVQNKDAYNISVMLMSFGGWIFNTSCYCDSNPVANEYNFAVSQGLFAVSASGNDGEAYLKTPACGSNVTSVGAVDKDDNIANFTNIEPLLDLLALGVDVKSTKMGGGYETKSGTSASAAVVAGIASLILENETLSPADLQYRLKSTSVLLEHNGTSYPRVDAYAAVTNNQTNTPAEQNGNQCTGRWSEYEPLAGCCIDKCRGWDFGEGCEGEICTSGLCGATCDDNGDCTSQCSGTSRGTGCDTYCGSCSCTWDECTDECSGTSRGVGCSGGGCTWDECTDECTGVAYRHYAGCSGGSCTDYGCTTGVCGAECQENYECDYLNGCSGSCPGCVFSIYSCSSGCFCTSYSGYNPDSGEGYCTSCSQQWNVGGSGDCTGEAGCLTACCGDDSGEKYRTFVDYAGNSYGVQDWGSSQKTCCDSSTDQINYNSQCVTANDGPNGAVDTGYNGHDKYAAPYSGGWLECDGHSSWATYYCANVCSGGWVYYGDATGEKCSTAGGNGCDEAGQGDYGCCGDDTGENYKVQTNYPDQGGELAVDWITGVGRCCDSSTDHVDYNGNCVPSIDAYGNAVATGYTGHDKYAAKVSWYGWLDCDRGDGPGGWCSNVCATGAALAAGESGVGEYTVGSCCGDDSGEYYRTREYYSSQVGGFPGSDSNDKACCNAASDCVYNGVCYTADSGWYTIGAYKAYCSNQGTGQWLNADGHYTWCDDISGTAWNVGYGDIDAETDYYWPAGSRPDYCNIGLGGYPSRECCCGDDSGEYYRTRVGSTDAPSGFTTDANDKACCDTGGGSGDSVKDGVCVAQGTAYGTIPNRAWAYWGVWYGGDCCGAGECAAILGYGGTWAVGGEVAATNCCGDDTGENYRTCTDSSANGDCGADTTACCSANTKCIDHNGACQSTGSCYTFGSGGLKSYCNSGTWEDPDEGSSYCAASGCGYTWMTYVPTSGTRCCADDSTSDNSYYYSAAPTTAETLLCERCNAGSYVAATTYYGNGYNTSSETTSTSLTCYYGDITCTAASGANGASSTLYGNGYWTASTCYYGDITCSDGSTANGASNSTLCTQAQGATCCPDQGHRAEGVACNDGSVTGSSIDRDTSSARCIATDSGCSAYSWVAGSPNRCCGDDAAETWASGTDGVQSCCNAAVISDDTYCSSDNYWYVDGAQCTSTVRDSGSMSGTTLSGDDLVCSCDSSGTICDTSDADALANGVCASSACTTTLVAKSGATYYSSCSNGYSCDTNVNSGGTIPTFVQDGMCVSTSCCTADVASGETSSPTWDDDEACGCSSAKNGQICDANVDGTWDGVCATDGSTWTCDTNTVFWNSTYYRTVRASDGSSDGKQCEDGSIGADGFQQEGYGLNDGICDTVGVTAEDCDSDANAACAGTEPFYNTCDARTTSADACDSTITSGTSWSQVGTCITGTGFPNDNAGYCDNAYEIVKVSSTYYNDCADTGVADGSQCDSSAASGDYSPDGVCTGDNNASVADCSTGVVSKNGADYIDSCGTDNYECDSDIDSSGYVATGSCQSTSCCTYVAGPRTSGQTCDADTDCANYSATGTCYYGALGDSNDGDCLSACTCSFSTDTTCPIATGSCTYGSCDSTYCLDDSANNCYYGNPTCSSGGWTDKSTASCLDPGTVSSSNCYYDNGGSVVRSNDCTVSGCTGISNQTAPSSCTSGAWADGAMSCWTGTTCYYDASDACAADTDGWDYSSGSTLCTAGVATCCPTQGTRAEGVACASSGTSGTSYDRDTSSARCAATDSGCSAYSWMVNVPTSGTQCCGDDASENSYYNSTVPTAASTLSCERCNAGSYVAPATLYGNGYNTTNTQTSNTTTCYYGDITCTAASGANGAASSLYGNGWTTGERAYSTSLTCYHGDITCNDGSIANSSSTTLYGNGYTPDNPETDTSGTCYHGDITCNDGSIANGTSATLYGNNYTSGNTCYYSDWSCGDVSIANGTTCVLNTGGGCVADIGCLNSPTSLTISAPSANTLFISWTDNSTVEQGFRIERSTDNSSWAVIATVAADVTNHTNSSLSTNTQYYFRVRAYYGTSNSGYTNVANKYTWPTNPAVSSTSHTVDVCSKDTTVNLTASATADHYHYVWDKSSGTSVGGSDTQWDGTELSKTATSDGDWYMHVISNNPEHVANPSGTVHSGAYKIDTTGPNAPTGLSPTAGTNTSDNTPTFGWDAPSDVGCSSVNGYNITIYTDASCSSSVQSSLPGTATYTASALSDGNYWWRIKAKDALNNWGSWSTCINITVDITAPTAPTLTTDSDKAEDVEGWSTTGNVSLSWSGASDATSGIDYYKIWRSCYTSVSRSVEQCLGGENNFSVVVPSTAQTTYTDTGRVTNTTYYYKIEVFDKAGNSANSTVKNLSVDTENPGVTITSPTPGQNINASSVTVFADYLNTYNVNCNITRTGDSAWYGMNNDNQVSGTANYTYSLSDGLYNFTVKCWDLAYNYQQYTVTSVRIDTVAPTTTDDSSSSWTSNDVTVTLTPSDNGSGIASTYYCVDVSGTCTPTTTGTSVDVTCASNSVCQKYVRYYSADNAGNAEGVKTSNIIRIDKQAPTTTDNSDSTWRSTDVNVTLTPSDNGSGLASTKYCIDNDGTCTPTTTGTSAPVTCASSSVCQQYVRYYSTDNVGNSESVKTSNVIRIDKQAPTTTFNSPGAGSWQAADFYVSLTDSDNGIGVNTSACYYRVLSNGLETKSWTARTCSASVQLTVGFGKDCAAEGQNNCSVEAYAVDNIGNTESVVSRQFSIDYTLPIITVNSPTTANPVYIEAGGIVTINYTYNEDRPSNITVRIYGASTLNQTIITDMQAGNITRTDNLGIPPGTSNGIYNLSVNATDVAGNPMTNTQIDSVVVDNIYPSVPQAAPNTSSPAYKRNNTQLNINFTYTEANAKNYSVSIFNSTTICSNASASISSGTQAMTTGCLISASAADGKYSIRITVYDNANHKTEYEQPEALIIDNMEPQSVVLNTIGTLELNAKKYAKGSITLNATASDNADGSGIERVEFYYNNTLIGTDYSAPYSVVWDTRYVPDGTYNVTARAHDMAGNYKTGG